MARQGYRVLLEVCFKKPTHGKFSSHPVKTDNLGTYFWHATGSPRSDLARAQPELTDS
jgi:hypothetical protein